MSAAKNISISKSSFVFIKEKKNALSHHWKRIPLLSVEIWFSWMLNQTNLFKSSGYVHSTGTKKSKHCISVLWINKSGWIKSQSYIRIIIIHQIFQLPPDFQIKFLLFGFFNSFHLFILLVSNVSRVIIYKKRIFIILHEDIYPNDDSSIKYSIKFRFIRDWLTEWRDNRKWQIVWNNKFTVYYYVFLSLYLSVSHFFLHHFHYVRIYYTWHSAKWINNFSTLFSLPEKKTHLKLQKHMIN